MPGVVDTSREDPLLGFSFGLDVGGGVVKGYFTEVSGLGSEHEVVEQKVINNSRKEAVMKVPGRLKWGDLVLKRGITSNMDMWKWRKQVEDGKVGEARKNGSIIMLDQTGAEKARWNFYAGWPSKITGPTPKADSNEIGVEELTIVHERIEREK
jgi:phage tail-like protein